MGGTMKDVIRVQLPSLTLGRTRDALRSYGRRGCEGFALWLGEVDGPRATVVELMTPPQRSIKSEGGVGYFLEPETLFTLNRYLSKSGLRLIAQVHSHPGEAYHSQTDDDYAIATKEGNLSLVVPYFARGPAELGAWAIYRLQNGSWLELPGHRVRDLFRVG